MSSRLVQELKVRARLRLNALKAGEPALQLRHCLNAVARDAGFVRWEHALKVLGGEAAPGDDMGGLWHAPACTRLLNRWFADYAGARAALQGEGAAVLLPYRRQFVLATADYLQALQMDPQDPGWSACGRDLAAAYGSPAWEALAWRRVQAMRGS